MKNLKSIAPDYPRIMHLPNISNVCDNDIVLNEQLSFPFKAYVQEKVDGANLRISWYDGPVLGNREHILRKGYMKNTPAKKQFVPAWNWLHSKECALKNIISKYGQITIYGEWMLAKHSLGYDKIPDYFMAYDIWSVEMQKFFRPDTSQNILIDSGINFVPQEQIEFKRTEDILSIAEKESKYRSGRREGIVLKTTNGNFIDNMYKVVNKYYVRDDGFNDRKIIKNKILLPENQHI